ncbi:MAG: hypothetical protein ABSG01_10925 [Anaerolineales bacterium]|jgi:hypothetical protein
MVDPFFTPAAATPSDSQKHSRIGIASFVIGLVSMFIFCLAIVLAFGYGLSITATNPSFQVEQSNPTVLGLGLLLFSSPILSLVGAVLGFVAVFQKDKKKLFSVLGIVLNLLIMLTFCALLVIGLVGQSGALGL